MRGAVEDGSGSFVELRMLMGREAGRIMGGGVGEEDQELYFQAGDGIRGSVASRGVGDVYKARATGLMLCVTRNRCHCAAAYLNMPGVIATT